MIRPTCKWPHEARGVTQPFDISAIGAELFGPNWQAPVAELLEINLRTVQRWASGRNPVPDHAREMLLALLRLVRRYRASAPI